MGPRPAVRKQRGVMEVRGSDDERWVRELFAVGVPAGDHETLAQQKERTSNRKEEKLSEASLSQSVRL